MKEKIEYSIADILSGLFLALNCFKELLKHLFKDSSKVNIYQGIMCQVLHMARCTNVIRLEHLALYSELVSGIVKGTNYTK